MKNILLGIQNLTLLLTLLVPLIYLIIGWKKIEFKSWKELLKSAISPTIKSLIEFLGTVLSVFIVGVIMPAVISHPNASVYGWNELVSSFMRWLSLLFGIFWLKNSVQTIKDITKAKNEKYISYNTTS